MENAEKRNRIITRLREVSSSLGFKRSKASQIGRGKWARISAAETVFEWGEDEEPEQAMIYDALKGKLDELHSKLDKLALVLKPLCDSPAAGA